VTADAADRSARGASDRFGWVGPLRERYGEVLARRRLRACTAVGARPRLRSAPFIYNTGSLVIGDDFWMDSAPVRSHLFVTGDLCIGNRVRIGAGAAISCVGDMEIHDDVSIGAFTIVLDTNFHVAEDFKTNAIPKRIRIGEGVRIGHRVVILPGSMLGARASVKAGSVVSGDIAEGAIVEGNPARAPLEGGDRDRDTPDDVPALVMKVLGLSSVPDVHAGPGQIPQWDSLGALRLIVALEERLGVVLAEDQVKTVRSIRELMDHVEAVQRRTGRGDWQSA
jgi:acetyltransferase-like isoleucine patch superfamily enzyme/acyl carrier protein